MFNLNPFTLPTSRLLATLMAMFVLSACSGAGSGAIASIQSLYGSKSTNREAIDNAPRQAGFNYLRVSVPNGEGLMAQGYEFKSQYAEPNQQVWFSSDGGVLRLRGGLIEHTAKLPFNVSDAQLAARPSSNTLQFEFTQPETGLYQVTNLLVPETAFAPDTALAALAMKQGAVHWFAYKASQPWPNQLKNLQPLVLGLTEPPDNVLSVPLSAKAVYGRQCFTPAYCVEWLREQGGAK